MASIRTEPGINLWHLIIIIFFIIGAVKSGSFFLLGLAVYLCFSSVVAQGFWPYLSDDDIIELRRKEMDERTEHRAQKREDKEQRIENDRDNET